MKTNLFLARFAALALALLVPAAYGGPQAPEAPLKNTYRIRDGGRTSTFEVALDEIGVREKMLVSRPVKPQASADAVRDQARAAEQAGAKVADLILYPQGVTHNEYTRRFVTRTVLAELTPGTDASALATAVGATRVESIYYAPGYWMFHTDRPAGALTMAEALRGKTGVVSAETQLAALQAKMFVPNDPLFTNQWHLLNVGQTGGTPGFDVRVTNVWERFRGNGITIGIVDDSLQMTHPDLATNVVPGLGYDFRDGDSDPSPDVTEDFHGTAVAGVAAGQGNNGIGVSGSAPAAGLAGLRLIGGPTPDADVALTILHRIDAIQVKNNSWGFPQYGMFMTALGPLSQAALRHSTTVGRGGRGTVHVFAAGNGLEEGSDSNYGGAGNTIYTVTVSAVNDRGIQTWYSEPGANIVVNAPSGDSGTAGRPDITTTDLVGNNGYNGAGSPDYTDRDYTWTFSGTSSACPLASGVIALLLEANPNLGWRDVQEVIMRSATFNAPTDLGWYTNGAGIRFNHKYGAGTINAEAAIALANNWTILPPQTNTSIALSNLSLVIPDGDVNGATQDFDLSASDLRAEQVTLTVDISHGRRSQLEILLQSPSGTEVLMASRRVYDPFADIENWTFKTCHFWGEQAAGTWRATVRDRISGTQGVVNNLALSVYGVSTNSIGSQVSADLAVKATVRPDPVLKDSNLTYDIVVTNTGIYIANQTVVKQFLPPGVIYVTASSTVGTISQAAGQVTWNVGNVDPRGSATLSVRTIPTVSGTLYSTIDATTAANEADTSNNRYIVSARVLPPTADLSVSLTDTPDPVLVGGTVTYVATILNRGPSTAEDVWLTNAFPTGVLLDKVTASQGTPSINGNNVLTLIGSLTNGARATLTVRARPFASGNLVASAAAASALTSDLVLGNNAALTATAVSPAADLVVALRNQQDPVVIGSNLTYVVSVTNVGPSEATAVVVNHALPAGLPFVGTSASQGSAQVNGTTLIWTIGSLPPLATASLTAQLHATQLGVVSSSVNVSAGQADVNTSNNTAAVTTTIAPPFSDVVASTTRLDVETQVNGAIDRDETVTISLGLRNSGNIRTPNVQAKLLATGGVIAPSGVGAYGVIMPGAIKSQPFTFTAPSSGATVTATLEIKTNGVFAKYVAFEFKLSTVTSFANATPIIINDNAIASPYPTAVTVSGVTGQVSKVAVTLVGVSHYYTPDVNVLLVGPTGSKTVLMAGAGKDGLTGASLRFEADAGAQIPQDSPVGGGSYRPANYKPGFTYPAPAPEGSYASDLNLLAGTAPNGEWSLYVVDDATGDDGIIAGGWQLEFTTIEPVNRQTDVRVAGSVTPASDVRMGDVLAYSYAITNAGQETASGVLLSNPVPAGLKFLSAATSELPVHLDGNVVFSDYFTLASGSNLVLTLLYQANTAGTNASQQVVNVTSVQASELDPMPANNSVTLTTLVTRPQADLRIAELQAPAAGLVGSNLVYVVRLTNAGPEAVLDATLTNTLPASLYVVSVTSSVGTAFAAPNQVIGLLGRIEAGATAEVSFTAVPTAPGGLAVQAVASSLSGDPAPGNNSASATTQVAMPAPGLVAAGVRMVTESALPPNGVVDPSETVTLEFALQNGGSAAASGVVASLLTAGGVTLPSGPQDYGTLVPGGTAVSRTFTFTASPGAGNRTATLRCTYAGGTADVAFTLYGPVTTPLANTTQIVIPEVGPARLYPSVINVTGQTGVVSGVTVVLSNLTHSFPADVDVMLVSPKGRKVMVLSDAGGAQPVTNVVLTFKDAASASLSEKAAITTGVWRPTNYGADDQMPYPAPPGAIAGQFQAFAGDEPNGSWELYVSDDAGGDAGQIQDGWLLILETVVPVSPAPARLSIGYSQGQPLVIALQGQPYENYELSASADLQTWMSLGTKQTDGTGSSSFTDPAGPVEAQRFYRATFKP